MPRLQKGTALALDEFGYGRDVVPLSSAVDETNRRYQVAPRVCPRDSIGVTDNDWFAFLSQQLGIDEVNLNRYHIESGVSISGSHSKLTAKPFSEQKLKIRVETAVQRRTIGYFIERKFSAKPVVETLQRYGFYPGK
ncbi:MAG: hypothetical protein JSW12_19330 [Deltaproteobacteria bacterium]|nr:MAG: hypothetical protein JSW12_19330 [Deltaproteobacteria bacterium]